MSKGKMKREIKEDDKKYLNYLANYITAYVKRFGIHILRYDSKTTESIYLKFDYGVSGSLRLSTHSGKDGLRYTFNIIKGIKNPYKEKCKASRGFSFERYFYTDILYKNVAKDIVRYKQYKLDKYGEAKYFEYINNKKSLLGKGDKFWSMCKEV